MGNFKKSLTSAMLAAMVFSSVALPQLQAAEVLSINSFVELSVELPSILTSNNSKAKSTGEDYHIAKLEEVILRADSLFTKINALENQINQNSDKLSLETIQLWNDFVVNTEAANEELMLYTGELVSIVQLQVEPLKQEYLAMVQIIASEDQALEVLKADVDGKCLAKTEEKAILETQLVTLEEQLTAATIVGDVTLMDELTLAIDAKNIEIDAVNLQLTSIEQELTAYEVQVQETVARHEAALLDFQNKVIIALIEFKPLAIELLNRFEEFLNQVEAEYNIVAKAVEADLNTVVIIPDLVHQILVFLL